MEILRIVFLCISAAIAYGIVHDQITARICLEYFSVFHPTILPLKSPTLLALQWGVVATWWVGAVLGTGLAIAARGGPRKPLTARDLHRPIFVLLIFMAAVAVIAGIGGYAFARNGFIETEWLNPVLSPPMQPRFVADLWAHSASYAVGILGGIVVCVQTYLRRQRTAVAEA